MKRKILEWSVILSGGVFLALLALWTISVTTSKGLDHVTVPTSRSAGDDLHLLIQSGNLWFCDQVDWDASGNARADIIDPRTHIAPKIRKIGRHAGLGFDLQYCVFAPDGYVVWSLKLSLLFPITLSLLAAALFRFRLKRLRGRVGQRAGKPQRSEVTPA
jgi:hypothetical protein